jgi:hypothetical protein
MGQLVLLVVAAAWAAVLIPPLLRSRIDNRPNSSVTDFRNQLSSLQKAVPPRSVTVRSMARPLAPPPPLPPPPSPLRRPAAAGRPVLPSGVRKHERTTVRSTLPAPQSRIPPPLPAEVRSRSHGSRARAADRRRHRSAQAASPVVVRNGIKRRRANVLFVLVLIAACSLFLAATMQTESLYYVAGAAFVGLCAYVYVLAHRRKREVPASRRPARTPPRLRRADEESLDLDVEDAPVPERRRRSHGPTVRYEERPARTRREPSSEPNAARRRRPPAEHLGEPAVARRRARPVEPLDRLDRMARPDDAVERPRRRRQPDLAPRGDRRRRPDERSRPSAARRGEAPSRVRAPRDSRAAVARDERFSSAV